MSKFRWLAQPINILLSQRLWGKYSYEDKLQSLILHRFDKISNIIQENSEDCIYHNLAIKKVEEFFSIFWTELNFYYLKFNINN